VLSMSTHKMVLRNYEGVITTYQEPEDYKPARCDLKCQKCSLQLEEDDMTPIGIEKLLADADETISLVPKGNLRLGRRKSRGCRGD
jgi:lysine 2,3-aminomutase